MLIEFHILQNHAPSNLNRDDSGSPKECVFGGARRARISSQCLKRAIRRSDIFQRDLQGHLGTRTRQLPEIVRKALLEADVAADMAAIAARKVSGFGTRDGKEREPDKTSGKYLTAQTMFLTNADIDAVVGVMKTAVEEAGSAKKLTDMTAKELQSRSVAKGFRPISVDVALFGRMVTSEAFRDVEAACQVAHAISTHKVDHEYDYYTAVDDLQGIDEAEREEDAGADMIGDIEYNSACYYKYLSVDTSELVRNLTGAAIRGDQVTDEDRRQAQQLACRAVGTLLEGLILTSPSGKQNSFASHTLPSLVLVEARPVNTPVSYANAFVEPVRPLSKLGGDLVSESMEKLAVHAAQLTKAFNLKTVARLALAPTHPNFAMDGVERVEDLATLRARVERLCHE